MNGNPFYVAPLGGVDLGGSVMQGLQMRERRDLMDERRSALEQQQQAANLKQQRMEQARDAALAAYDAGDANAMQRLKIMYPEELKDMTTDIFTSPESEKLMRGGWKALYNNPEDADLIWNSMIARGEQLPGVTMDDSRADYQEWIDSGRDPEMLKRKARTMLTLFDEDFEDTGAGATAALTQGMSPEQKAAFNAAYGQEGGGAKGLDAGLKAAEATQENLGRQAIPQLVEDRFGDATDEEKRALQQRIMDAPSLAEGMEQARELRTEQQDKRKGQQLVDRGRQLLTRVINSPELSDVLGSIEGQEKDPLWYPPRGDVESGLIADIEELKAILTKDNLKLMTGVLSQTDLELLIRLSSGGLDRRRGEETFKSDAQQILDSLGGAVGTEGDASGASNSFPTVTTREEYDALPAGTYFIQNGRRRQKPRG